MIPDFRRRGLLQLGFLICAGFALAPRPAAATSLVLLPTEKLTAGSDTILVGEVARTESYWRGNQIVTRVIMRVEEIIKGERRSVVEIIVGGGSVGGLAMRVIGGPQFATGDRAVVFLRRGQRNYRVRGMAQGKLEVRRGANDEELVRWIAPGKRRYELVPLAEVVGALRGLTLRREP